LGFVLFRAFRGFYFPFSDQWFVVGVAGAFMITNTISFVISLVMVGLILLYRRPAV
jgi:hypothetical protein